MVSVIIPNYNHERFLSQRIESVLQQTVANIEVIILDDCSTDNSVKIIQEYATKDNRIKTLFNRENSGSPFKQWKKGIELATSDLIWIAESDDFSDYYFIQSLLPFFEEAPLVGVAYCQSNFVDEQGKIFGNHLENLRQLDTCLWEGKFCIDGKRALTEFMPIINIIPNVSAAIFRKTLTENMDWVGLFRFTLAGDRYFWIQLLQQGQLAFRAEMYNFFRFSGATVRAQNEKNIKYLAEMVDIFHWLSKTVNIPYSTRKKAIRQWLHQVKKIRSVKRMQRIWFWTSVVLLGSKLVMISLMPLKVNRWIFAK